MATVAKDRPHARARIEIISCALPRMAMSDRPHARARIEIGLGDPG